MGTSTDGGWNGIIVVVTNFNPCRGFSSGYTLGFGIIVTIRVCLRRGSTRTGSHLGGIVRASPMEKGMWSS